MKNKKSRIIKFDEHARWWLGSGEPIKLAFQKDDDWWLIDAEDASASYVNPDMDIEPKKEKIINSPKKKNTTYIVLVILSMLLGISLAVNLVYFLFFFF